MPAATDNAVAAASTEVKRFVKATNGATTTGAGAPPPEHEHLPCPRCDSPNTKFCYYNNYNFSQPRHFCKACRRYWTHGGTLRDIPIGGGTRKNAKRSRTSATVVCPISAASMLDHHNSHTTLPLPATPVLVPLMGNQGHFGDGKGSSSGSTLNSTVCGSFTSLLSTQGPGFLALGGFGLGLGNGFEDVDFGLGRAVWPFPGVGVGGAAGGHGGGGGSAGGISHGWQFDQNGGENGFAGVGDCFSWPDLAISTPGNGLK